MCTKTKKERNKYSLKTKLSITRPNTVRIIEEKEKYKYNHCPVRGVSCRRNFVSLIGGVGCRILIVRMISRGILGNVILLHAILIAKKNISSTCF